jgi:hypothetical protein
MSLKSPPSSSAPMLKNVATAPLVYFDNVPAFGTCNGSITVELATQALIPKPDGTCITDLMCTAHLRCSPMAAKILIASLTNAIEMMEKQMEAQREQERESQSDYLP